MRLPLPQFAIDNRHPEHIAEVIETATTQFLAQCLEPEELNFPQMPPFGSWVKSIDEESGNKILAVVTYVTTSPIDSIHRARALGLSLTELREQQPQIFAMLKTEFRAAIVGFETPLANGHGNGSRPGQIYQYIPPRPPQIHQAVYRCHPSEIVHFSEELDFLRTLLLVKDVPVEALVAASVREIYQLRQGDRQWLVQVGRQLNMLLKDDYDRLRYILTQIHW
ncbi:HAS-barrel domain-containing protein [Gloeothece verrucosa]|uniref:HerA-ATP synthase, barrel domain protein n=1 Tax=Gloeothece verrucosa (strain PCC 7822) TaxID=497965 RepID=E0UFR8_GLOV7|nr:HAS-barrel domain-containing protein [Gloeothece verrucosa]ADN13179.1 HerA-ATP synthase, barrel domain protein [Gloeothece verrucosa PCC 7822]